MKEGKFTKIAIFLIIVGLAAAAVLWQVYNRQLIARDSRRKADLAAVQNRIETHKKDYGRYPEDTKLPPDPVAQLHYVYRLSKDGSGYQLFARLENTKDPEILPGLPADCGVSCNYGLASPNIKLTETLW